MCLSTVRSVSQSRRAMPRLVRPSAMSASTSRSRGVSSANWSVERSGLRSSETTSGSSAEPPSATRRSASRNSSTSKTRSLSR
jgi:hypothetical protein